MSSVIVEDSEKVVLPGQYPGVVPCGKTGVVVRLPRQAPLTVCISRVDPEPPSRDDILCAPPSGRYCPV
ncbi:hypothetical protein [Citrobacter arsenatis]|uniref:hypothetical protein n=1 Tax=Citrobacter arsenatis TaxID=2546350 RepID=UPI00300DE141